MIGLTTYRDYFAVTGRSSKFECLYQYVNDIQEFLGEPVEVVPTSIIGKGKGTYDKYDRIIVFEHPTSLLQKENSGFTTPNIEMHFLQLEKLMGYQGEVLSYDAEKQDFDLWIKRIDHRRRNPKTAALNIATDEEFRTFFNRILSKSITKEVNEFRHSRPNWIVGDSHAPMLWKPGTTTYALPSRTLYRSLNEGLGASILDGDHLQSLTFCFGNIDLRHHLARQDDPKAATKKLAEEYIKQAESFDCQISVCELLPVIDQDQLVTRSYFYKGEPHFGTVKQRVELRDIFNETLHSQAKKVKVLKVPDIIFREDGLMNKDALEKTKGGIHISPCFYEKAASTNVVTPEYAWVP